MAQRPHSSPSNMIPASTPRNCLLHTLPNDLLVAVLTRIEDPAALTRLRAVSRSFKIAASSNIVWMPLFRSIWGSALLEGVLRSIEENEGAPEWMHIPARFSSAHQQALVECQNQWQVSPSIWAAFYSFDRLFSGHFMSDGEGCLRTLRNGLEEDEARKQASAFIFWVARERQSVDETREIRRIAVKCLTHKSATLSEEDAARSKVVRMGYIRNFDTRGCTLIEATKHFILRTSMPSEANRICRIMWDFAGHYSDSLKKGDPLYGQSQDVVYLLIWSMLVLNADAHNPQVRRKMILSEWVSNTVQAVEGVMATERDKGCNPPPLDSAYLESMYADVACTPLVSVLNPKATFKERLSNMPANSATGSGGAGGAFGSIVAKSVKMLGERVSSVLSW